MKKVFLCAATLMYLILNLSEAIASKSLIIGSRPWDEDLQGLNLPEAIDYIDFINEGAPDPLPKNFFHVDINDNNSHGAGNFIHFVRDKKHSYDLIVIDWATYQHLGFQAWARFHTLLKDKGRLVVPVNSFNIQENKANSIAKAEELKRSIDRRYSSTVVYTPPNSIEDAFPNFAEGAFQALKILNRQPRREVWDNKENAILVATK